jgi:hypothetical protein
MRSSRIFLLAACGLLLASMAYGQTTIYVDSGSFSSPYYRFYSDSSLTQQLDIYSGGTDSLLIGQSYTFTGGSSSHPFYLSNLGVQTPPSSLISMVGDGSATTGITGTSQSFTLSFNGFDPSDDTLTFFCTNHSSMNGTLQVVPEPSAAMLLLLGGVVAAATFCHRCRSRGGQAAQQRRPWQPG